MGTIRSLFFYWKHIFYMTFNNSLRLSLSLIGLCMGILVFSLGNILINSYYEEQLKYVNEMNEETVMLDVESTDEQFMSKLKELKKNNLNRTYFDASPECICVKQFEDKGNLVVNANMVGISNLKGKTVPVRGKDDVYIPKNVELKSGRWFINSDSRSKVAIIDELTEKILFSGESAIDKDITIGVGEEGIASISVKANTEVKEKKLKLKVIGVVKRNYYTEQQKMKVKKILKNKSEGVILNTLIYCPVHIVKDKEDVEEKYIWCFKDIKEKQNFIGILNDYVTVYSAKYVTFEITDKQSVYEKEKSELNPLKVFINIISFGLLIFSGINMLTTMFFSIKERINEIGIKKALGATKLDIIVQFTTEGIILTTMAAVIAIFLSLMVAYGIQSYVNNSMFICFEVQYTIKNIVLPLCIAELYGMIFCLFPSIYGASIQVTNALRFE